MHSSIFSGPKKSVQIQLHGFPRQVRLLSSREYKQVFDSVTVKVSGKCVVMLARLNDQETARLGLIVPKKHIKRAVDRNCVKRLIRDSFRQTRQNLPSLDIIVLIRSKTDQISNKEFQQLLDKLWHRLIIEISKKTG